MKLLTIRRSRWGRSACCGMPHRTGSTWPSALSPAASSASRSAGPPIPPNMWHGPLPVLTGAPILHNVLCSVQFPGMALALSSIINVFYSTDHAHIRHVVRPTECCAWTVAACDLHDVRYVFACEKSAAARLPVHVGDLRNGAFANFAACEIAQAARCHRSKSGRWYLLRSAPSRSLPQSSSWCELSNLPVRIPCISLYSNKRP